MSYIYSMLINFSLKKRNKWIVLTFDGVQLGRRSKDPATQEMNEYTDLMTWLSAEAEEVLQIVDQPVTDRQQEYMVQYKLNTEYHQTQHTSLVLYKFSPTIHMYNTVPYKIIFTY